MTEVFVFLIVILFVAVFGLVFRHFLNSSWQRGYKEGFSVGLKQRIVKVQKSEG